MDYLWSQESVRAALAHGRLAMAAVVVLALVALDTGRRRVPNGLTYAAVLLGVATGGWRAALVALGAAGLVWLADYPGGDVKGAAAILVWYPAQVAGIALVLAVTVTVLTPERRWPWLPVLGISAGLAWYTMYQIGGA